MTHYIPKLNRINPSEVNFSFYTGFTGASGQSGTGSFFNVSVSGGFLNYFDAGFVYKVSKVFVNDVHQPSVTFVPTSSPVGTGNGSPATYQLGMPSPAVLIGYPGPATWTVGIQLETTGMTGTGVLSTKLSEEYLRFSYIFQ